MHVLYPEVDCCEASREKAVSAAFGAPAIRDVLKRKLALWIMFRTQDLCEQHNAGPTPIISGEELNRFSNRIYGLMIKSSPCASLADRFREALEGIPPFLVVMIISMLPIFELRGGIPAGAALGMPVWQAAVFAVIGNMIPIPFILLFLGPASRWLSEHSRLMRRFFDWLFARTRRRQTKSFERWKEFALVIFVAIPLPITGAWTGSVAAFLFGIPFRVALPLIFFGVVIAAVVVSLATSFSFLLGWQGSLIFFALLAGVLAYIYVRARREPVEELPVDDRPEC